MLQTIEGVYRDGKVELCERPAAMDEARVLVVFLPAENGTGPQGTFAAKTQEAEHPLMQFAGIFENDPMFDEWQEAIREYRRKLDLEEEGHGNTRAD